ncbi:MAG: sensor histidine kinase [Chloroflexi bacterium]|nr:MAG: sensor histidine kinase [Chloroflexota bacterium]
MPASLRWRLPLSYAAIALLTAAALGLVLLVSLSGFYQQQEVTYLSGNAATIAEEVRSVMGDAERPFLQTQIDGFAFLVQAQIEILDPNKKIIADSGAAGLLNPAIAISPGIEIEEESLFPGLGNIGQEEVVIVVEEEDITVDGVFTSEKTITRTSTIPARDTLYGFSLNGETENIARSDLAVEVPILDDNNQIVGFVRLSQGPAYGRSILRSVTLGWGIAGIVAVLIAAMAGWLSSRHLTKPLLDLTETTTHMAQGDLTVRTDLQREDELGQLGSAFNQMAQRIENTVTTLRHFVADAAHELNTPLTALNTNLELARQHTNDEQQATRLSRAQEQTTRLQTLTNSLLALSKIEASENSNPLSKVNLAQLVQQIGEIYASQAEQNGLTFDITVPEASVFLAANPQQFEQAIGNLLDNALKFSPPDGNILISLITQQDQAIIRVTDTGIGIPEEDMAKLFSRFHRGRNVGNIQGNGLGLAIAKAIVERHGGEITAVSHPGDTQFSIILPFKTA